MHQDAADDPSPLIYILLLLFVLLLLFTLKKNCTLFLCARLEAEPTIFTYCVERSLQPISKGPTPSILLHD